MKAGSLVKKREVVKAFWAGTKPYKIPFFAALSCYIASSVFSVFIPLYYKKIIDILTTTTRGPDQTHALVGVIITILIFHSIVWFFFRLAWFNYIYASLRGMAHLKQNAFSYMMQHSYSFFASSFTGSLVQRVNRFARAYDRINDRIVFSIIPLTVSIIGVTIILGRIKIVIAFIILGWVTLFMLFNYFFSRWKLKYNIQMAEADSRSTAVLSDAVTNHNAIHLFTGMEYEQNQYKEVTNNHARISIFTWNLSGVVDAVQASLIFIAEFILFYFAIRYWEQGLITIGVFVLIQTYILNLGSKLWDFSRIIRDFYEGFADAKEMVEIMTQPHDIKDLPRAGILAIEHGEIVFDHVSFNFNETRAVLHDISLTIKPGEKVAFVGPSGAGKSTLVRLILRLYETGAGKILIDGQDIKTVSQESLRRMISFVPQDPVLFHRTLRENIQYGKPDATEEEVLNAAKLAHCDEFIKDLPLGYETYVGERGIKLSGGERQRIAIARALLKNAPILILDEATSSLDSHSETLIQDALDVLIRGRTTIVIAHRLSTIRKMDRIVVIENGEIQEEGNHEKLLKNKNGLYKKLWSLQSGGFLRQKPESEGL